MQKRFFSTEFFIILLFFALPPIIFPGENPAQREVHFSWVSFALAALAGGLWWQMKMQSADRNEENKDTGRVTFFLQQGQALVTFGGLLVCAGLLELTARFILGADSSTVLLPPKNAFGWVNAVFGTISAAFYEEVLYRVYLPDRAKKIFARQKNHESNDESRQKKKAWLCEIFVLILFALAHRYAGWLSVANALAGGILLRICYKKTGALWTNLSAHIAYNAVMTAINLG